MEGVYIGRGGFGFGNKQVKKEKLLTGGLEGKANNEVKMNLASVMLQIPIMSCFSFFVIMK